MKKIYTLLVATFLSVASFAQSSDLELINSLRTPMDTLRIQNPPVGKIIAWGFINHGPNPVLSSDTLFLGMLNVGSAIKLTLPAAGIPVGDTVVFIDTFAFASGPANGSIIQWCDTVWAKRSGGAILPDPVIANNKECSQVYVINQTTGISELFNSGSKAVVSNLMLYPNPATDKISFEYEFKGKPVSIHVYDMVGRKVYSEQVEKKYSKEAMRIDVSNLTNGLYSIEAVEEGRKSVGRISVQH